MPFLLSSTYLYLLFMCILHNSTYSHTLVQYNLIICLDQFAYLFTKFSWPGDSKGTFLLLTF